MILSATPIEQYSTIIDNLKSGFDDAHTRNIEFRKEQLQKLFDCIKKREVDIQSALFNDLRKSPEEAYLTEIGPQLAEIKHTLKHLNSWAKRKSVSTPMLLFPSKSYIQAEPKGVVVIFAPWNYPFGLVIGPLVAALAAGNTILIKPAHETPHVAELLKNMIHEIFSDRHVNVITGEGPVVGDILLDQYEFDHIFFTGSVAVGKHIMAKAAKTLTPVSLELGGKSPAIVDKSADIAHTVKRIVWAKYLNCGQTCIAPDYVIVQESIYDQFVSSLIDRVKHVYTAEPEKIPYYNRIVNKTRFDKLVQLLNGVQVLYGGKVKAEDLFIEPTVVAMESLDHPLMNQEIFGPILPVVKYKDDQELRKIIRYNNHPLAMYLFANDTLVEKTIMNQILSGAVCINDCAVHYGNPNLPFGGIKTSGLGAYHGQFGFETFSHMRSIVKSGSFADLSIKYPPYTQNLKLIRKMFEGWF